MYVANVLLIDGSLADLHLLPFRHLSLASLSLEVILLEEITLLGVTSSRLFPFTLLLVSLQKKTFLLTKNFNICWLRMAAFCKFQFFQCNRHCEQFSVDLCKRTLSGHQNNINSKCGSCEQITRRETAQLML